MREGFFFFDWCSRPSLDISELVSEIPPPTTRLGLTLPTTASLPVLSLRASFSQSRGFNSSSLSLNQTPPRFPGRPPFSPSFTRSCPNQFLSSFVFSPPAQAYLTPHTSALVPEPPLFLHSLSHSALVASDRGRTSYSLETSRRTPPEPAIGVDEVKRREREREPRGESEWERNAEKRGGGGKERDGEGGEEEKLGVGSTKKEDWPKGRRGKTTIPF